MSSQGSCCCVHRAMSWAWLPPQWAGASPREGLPGDKGPSPLWTAFPTSAPDGGCLGLRQGPAERCLRGLWGLLPRRVTCAWATPGLPPTPALGSNMSHLSIPAGARSSGRWPSSQSRLSKGKSSSVCPCSCSPSPPKVAGCLHSSAAPCTFLCCGWHLSHSPLWEICHTAFYLMIPTTILRLSLSFCLYGWTHWS